MVSQVSLTSTSQACGPLPPRDRYPLTPACHQAGLFTSATTPSRTQSQTKSHRRRREQTQWSGRRGAPSTGESLMTRAKNGPLLVGRSIAEHPCSLLFVNLTAMKGQRLRTMMSSCTNLSRKAGVSLSEYGRPEDGKTLRYSVRLGRLSLPIKAAAIEFRKHAILGSPGGGGKVVPRAQVPCCGLQAAGVNPRHRCRRSLLRVADLNYLDDHCLYTLVFHHGLVLSHTTRRTSPQPSISPLPTFIT